MNTIFNMRHANYSFPAEVSAALLELGESFKTARLRRKMTQNEVAKRLDCSRQTINAAENGSPSVAMGTYIKLAWVYGLQRQWVDALSPIQDSFGLSLERSEARKRGHSTKVLDNNF